MITLNAISQKEKHLLADNDHGIRNWWVKCSGTINKKGLKPKGFCCAKINRQWIRFNSRHFSRLYYVDKKWLGDKWNILMVKQAQESLTRSNRSLHLKCGFSDSQASSRTGFTKISSSSLSSRILSRQTWTNCTGFGGPLFKHFMPRFFLRFNKRWQNNSGSSRGVWHSTHHRRPLQYSQGNIYLRCCVKCVIFFRHSVGHAGHEHTGDASE